MAWVHGSLEPGTHRRSHLHPLHTPLMHMAVPLHAPTEQGFVSPWVQDWEVSMPSLVTLGP